MIAVVISAIVEKFVYKYVHCIFLGSLMYVNYHLLDARSGMLGICYSFSLC